MTLNQAMRLLLERAQHRRAPALLAAGGVVSTPLSRGRGGQGGEVAAASGNIEPEEALASHRAPPARECRRCGCTDDDACLTPSGPCWWVESDLCSACVAGPGAKTP